MPRTRWQMTTPAYMMTTILLLLILVVALAPVNSVTATGTLAITPITLDVIGLDSSSPMRGPRLFPVAARVCNTGGTAITDVSVSFVAGTTSAYISTQGATTLTYGTLAANMCVDAYFTVQVVPLAATYDQVFPYQITARATSVASVQTLANRQLYVEKLIAQDRHSVASVTGPKHVQVGQSYQ